MNDEKLKEEVINLIADTLEVDPSDITEKSNLVSDLEMESLDLVSLVVAFENKFNTEIPDNEIKNLQTVGDIIEFIKKQGK